MLYVARERSNILVVVDGSTNEIVENLEIIGPYDIAINPKTNMIYVTSKEANSVFVVNGATNEVEASISVSYINQI